MAASRDAIFQIIARETSLDRDSLRPDATLEELDISSLDFVSALFTIEEECGVVIDPDRFGPTSTIGELVEHVSSQTQG